MKSLTSRAFSEAELKKARQEHGPKKVCPHCNEECDIDDGFGWRRMRPGTDDIRPQAWVPVEYEVQPMHVEWVAIPTGDDFGLPGRSRDRAIAVERGWAE